MIIEVSNGLLLTVFSVHAFHYSFILIVCRVLDSLQNVELIYSIYYDKTEMLRFHNTENKVDGYTEYTMKWVEDLNKKPEWLQPTASALGSNSSLRKE